MPIWAGSFELTDAKTADYQAANAQIVRCDTSGGTFVVSAPLLAFLGEQASFGIHMDDQDNPVTILALDVMAQPTAQSVPKLLTFDVIIDGVLYFVFTGTEWLIL